MADFINLVLDSTKEYEAPKRFYYWAALTAVSAVLKDHVFFDMGKAYKLYPNIYVLLYGPSGVRKGPAIALAEQVVKKVDNTRVIDGRSSIEAIIKELGTQTSRPPGPDKKLRPPFNDSCALVSASELSSSLIANPSAMDIMTALYDRIYNEGEWKYRLKVGESQTLNKPTITWIAGTNEALFRDFIPDKNIHGGLIGRMFLIMETRPGNINSLMFDPQVIPNVGSMAECLRPLVDISGQFEMSTDLRIQMDTWYRKFVTDIAPQLLDETGFVSRILDFVMKVAMIISSGRRGDKIITEEDVKESWDVTIPLILPTKKISQTSKKEDKSEVSKRALILAYMSNATDFTCKRQEILRNLSLQINHDDLDETVNLLLQADAITLNNHGGEVHYKLKVENEKIRKWIENYRK